MRQDDFGGGREKSDAADQVVANPRVRLHNGGFLLRQLPWLEQDRVGNADFSDVVQVGAARDLPKLLSADAHGAGDFQAIQADAAGVPGGLRIPQVERRPQGFERLVVGGLDAIHGGAQLHGPLLHHLFEILAIILDLLRQPLVFERPRHAHHHAVELEGLQQIIGRPLLHRRDPHAHIVHTRCHEKRYVRVLASDDSQQFHSGHARHPQVADHHLEFLWFQNFERLSRIASRAAAVPFARKPVREQGGNRFLIIDK